MTETPAFTGANDSPETTARVARFGVFELDLRNAELRRDGVRVKLQEQPFRLLTLLVERAGDIVTREELQQTLWPSEFVDFDQGLNAAVRKLRTALDDTADNPRFVETIARRGYRFLAPVTWSPGVGRQPSPAKASRISLAIGAGLALIVVIAVVLFIRQRAVPRPSIDTIAVLPFAIENKANDDHLGDGLTEMLIDNLSRLPNLRVMARSTVFRYKGDIEPGRLAHDLGVNAVVTGRIGHDRNRYTIRVELIDVRDWTQVWGDRFEGGAADLPSLQNQISEQLSLRLRHGIHTRLGSATTNAQAYDENLKGLYSWNKRDLPTALQHFHRAAEYDPGFAAAYAGIANTYGIMVGYGILSPDDGVPKILAAAKQALDLDPDNVEALTCIATTKYRNQWDFAGAERDYRRAIAANPNYATAHQWFADYLRSMGRFAEAHRENELAYKLDPFSPSANAMLCYALVYERKYDEALAFSSKAAEIDPALAVPNCRMKALVAKGDFDSAAAAIDQLPSKSGQFSGIVERYRAGGPNAVRRTWLDYLLSEPNAAYKSPVEIAEAYVALGDRDRAFEWLEKAYGYHVSRLTNINVEPGFDPIRDDPRFDDLLKRIGLPKFPVPPSSSR
jgi:DNA-binding winged helix-turn-helix (wHTH) protein/TolB-like protein